MGIHRRVTAKIVMADMRHVHGVGHTGQLIQLLQKPLQIRVITDALAITLEMRNVNRVKAHQGSPQTNVRFGQGVADQVAAFAQALFQFLKTLEQGHHRFVIRLLTGGKTALVHAVIHVVIHPLIDGINVRPERLRVIISRRGTQSIEAGVEHANDVCRLIADNGFPLRVPEHRNGHAAGVVTVRFQVQLVQLAETVERIASGTRKPVIQFPATLQHVRMHHGYTDVILQPFQGTHDQGAMGPGTRIGHIQVITPALCRETTVTRGPGTAIGRYPVAKLTFRALESPAGTFRVVPLVLPFPVNQQSHHCLLTLTVEERVTRNERQNLVLIFETRNALLAYYHQSVNPPAPPVLRSWLSL